MRIAAIILAAGASSRFGTADKLLAPIDGVALVRRTADVLSACALDPILAVVAPGNQAIAHVLDGARVTLIDNARRASGMGTSIAAGIRALPGDTEGALVVPADMPALSPRLIERVIAAFRAAHGERIVHAVDSDGVQRNPVLWPRRQFHRLAALDGEAGGKTILAGLADEATAVRADDDRELDDVDTPEDLARWTDRRPGTGTGRRT